MFQKNILQIKVVDKESKIFFTSRMNEYMNEELYFQLTLADTLKKMNDPCGFGNYIIKNYKVFESY